MMTTELLGFDANTPPTLLDSLFRSVQDPTQWSMQIPSHYGMWSLRTNPRFVEPENHELFPLAFVFSRELTRRNCFQGPLLVDQSIADICEAWSMPDFATTQLASFRTSRKNLQVCVGLMEKFDFVGELYSSIVDKLILDIQTNLYTATTMTAPTDKNLFQIKLIYVSKSAIEELDFILETMERVLKALAKAKRSVHAVQPNVSKYLDIYGVHFNRCKDSLKNIQQKSQVVDDSEIEFRMNNHSENVFALVDGVRIMVLYFMLGASMESVLKTIGDQAVTLTEEGEIEDAKTQDLYEEMLGTRRLHLLHPAEERLALQKRFLENKQVAEKFERTLRFLIDYLNIEPLIAKIQQKAHDVVSTTEEETTLQEIPSSLILDLIQQGKELHAVFKNSTASEDQLRTSNSLLQLLNQFNDRNTEVYRAIHLQPAAFKEVLALLRQRMEMLYKDFLRSLSCCILKCSKLFSIDVSEIDNVYLGMLHSTNVDRHMDEFRLSKEGQQFLASKRKADSMSRAFIRNSSSSKIAEVQTIRQLSASCALHGLCVTALSRRHCRSSDLKQDKRTQVAMQMVRQYREVLIPLWVDFMEWKEVREISFFENIYWLSKLLDQNVMQMNKTYLAVLMP